MVVVAARAWLCKQRDAQFSGRGADDRAGRGRESGRAIAGQYSFGHAAFLTGAYVTAILQVRYGVNAWLGFGTGMVGGVGALTFRSGLRGSYFALVTLAFAEVLRIIASVPTPAPVIGATLAMMRSTSANASVTNAK